MKASKKDMTRVLWAASAALFFMTASPALAEEGIVSEPVILQMADGLYYSPAAGLSAVSRETLLELIRQGATAPVEPPASPPQPPSESRLQGAIIRARALVAERIAKKNAAQKKIPTVASTNTWVDVTLAVWNAATDEIRLVPVSKNGLKIDLSDAPDDVKVAIRRSNGVNSEFVLDGADQYVVAVQHPIFKEKWVTSKKRVYELHDVVYTPYASALHTPELVAWGESTMDGMIAEAYDDLRAMGLRSRAFPDRLMADVVDPELVKAIAVIEHLSETALAGENAQRAAESVYVTLAANQQAAYAHSRSSMGAKGLVQFIPSTYKLMVKRKELGLIEDFEKGMSDPRNAIRAQIAYLDAELASMPLAVKDLASVNPARVNEYLAAAYNGGGVRIRRAIAAWGDAWSGTHEADIADLRRQHAATDAEIASLQKQIGKTSDAKKLKSLKAQLVAAKTKHDAIYARQLKVKSGTLREETSIYVQKLRNLLALWNPSPTLS